MGLFRNIVDLKPLPLFILNDDLRVQVALVLHDDPAFGAGRISFLTQRLAFGNILEADAAAAFGENWRDVRVPFAQLGSSVNGLTVLDEEIGAIGDGEFFEDSLGPVDL